MAVGTFKIVCPAGAHEDLEFLEPGFFYDFIKALDTIDKAEAAPSLLFTSNQGDLFVHCRECGRIFPLSHGSFTATAPS